MSAHSQPLRTFTSLAFIMTATILMFPQNTPAQQIRPDTGNLYAPLQALSDSNSPSLSYLARDWADVEQWRIQGRAKMQSLLSYNTDAAPLDPVVLETVKRDGYTRELIRYTVTNGRSTEAYLLIPDGLTSPAPAVLALHDHGGFYYYGKEKHTATEGAPQILLDHIESAYGGRAYADALVRRGFVVLCPDAFYFGTQRLDDAAVSDRMKGDYPDLESNDINKRVRAFNRFSGYMETITAKTIFTAGATWPGILFQGDRASVDYLLTRPEVDGDRIGCMGLSIGGFRSAHLFGLDPRIKVGVVAGWMTSYDSLLRNHLRHHTWMVYVPGQQNYLDLPDTASLNAPRPLMVINCLKDQLFTIDGMKAAENKLAAVYRKMGASDKFKCNFYDVPHSLNVEMQEDAFDWIEAHLKP